jgi:hypothetical protein
MKKNPVGRPKLGKVKLSCQVKPETKAFLGDKPGDALDKLVERIKEGR